MNLIDVLRDIAGQQSYATRRPIRNINPNMSVSEQRFDQIKEEKGERNTKQGRYFP